MTADMMVNSETRHVLQAHISSWFSTRKSSALEAGVYMNEWAANAKPRFCRHRR